MSPGVIFRDTQYFLSRKFVLTHMLSPQPALYSMSRSRRRVGHTWYHTAADVFTDDLQL